MNAGQYEGFILKCFVIKLNFPEKARYWILAAMVFFLAHCSFNEGVSVSALGAYFINDGSLCLKYHPDEVMVDYTVLHDTKAISRTVNYTFPGKCLDDSIFENDGVYGVYYNVFEEKRNKSKYFFVRVTKTSGKFNLR